MVGFGYDVVFGGLGCDLVARYVFPQCWKDDESRPQIFSMRNESATDEAIKGDARGGLGSSSSEAVKCFNTQFIRLQEGWNALAATRPWVDVINILGTGQKAAGYKNVTVGQPDLTQFGPGRYYPLTLGCIHPSLVPHVPLASDSGANIVM